MKTDKLLDHHQQYSSTHIALYSLITISMSFHHDTQLLFSRLYRFFLADGIFSPFSDVNWTNQNDQNQSFLSKKSIWPYKRCVVYRKVKRLPTPILSDHFLTAQKYLCGLSSPPALQNKAPSIIDGLLLTNYISYLFKPSLMTWLIYHVEVL